MEMFEQERTQRSAATEKLEQEQAGCNGRNYERKGDEGLHECFAAPAASRQHPGEGEAEWQNHQRAQSARSKRERNHTPLVGCQQHHFTTPKPTRWKI